MDWVTRRKSLGVLCSYLRRAKGVDVQTTYPLILVEWEDSAQPTSGWQWLDEIGDSQPITCRTAGYLVAENEKGLTIALSIGDMTSQRPQVNGATRIPRRAIVSITSLAPCVQAHVA